MRPQPFAVLSTGLLAALCFGALAMRSLAEDLLPVDLAGAPTAAEAEVADDKNIAGDETLAEDNAENVADNKDIADDKNNEPTIDAPGVGEEVGLFEAMESGVVEVKFIAKNDHQAKILITNKLSTSVTVKMPEAFVGVPVLAQFGGGGGGGRGGGGGGFGGGGGGRGGGAFSIPPDRVTKIDVPVLCIEHGKPDPSSSNHYEIRPVESMVDRPEVVELLKAFGRGELQHNAAQAAVWNLQNDLSWQELSSKRTGTRRSLNRSPYFSRAELQAAAAYTQEAHRRGTLAEQEPATSPGYEEAEE